MAIKSRLSKVLFIVARSRVEGAVIGWSFAFMSSILPVEKLYESKLVVAFYHPSPTHKLHILIVPKRKLATFLNLTEADTDVLKEVTIAAQHIVQELELVERGYTILVNGGKYQDVKQVHFHLISDD